MKLFSLLAYVVILLLAAPSRADLFTDNNQAYKLIAKIAEQFLNYNHEEGATHQSCSDNGREICAQLVALARIIKLFRSPERQDLKKLSQDALYSFRDFDLSGEKKNRESFTYSLINLLKAVSPLLLIDEEVDKNQELIKKISATLQTNKQKSLARK